MASLRDLLNGAPGAGSGAGAGSGYPSGRLQVAAPVKTRTRVPQPRVSKAVLAGRKLVQIAVRRKLPLKRLQKQEGLKLHLKSLEAGLRFKLTLAPLLEALYGLLTPRTNRKGVTSELVCDEKTSDIVATPVFSQKHLHDAPLVSKLVQLIDNNLVDLAGVSNKVLQTFHLHRNDPGTISAASSESVPPTFNSLDTAILSLFGTREYLLVRVTRSTTSDSEGSSLLKLETAVPGDMALLDDPEYVDEMIHSIGTAGQTPSNLFMKKIVARPRYKSDMKIYFVPQCSQLTLYVDPRALERDLLHGLIDFSEPWDRKIFVNFKAEKTLADFYHLVKQCEKDEKIKRQKTKPVAIEEEKLRSSSLGDSLLDSKSDLLKLSSTTPPYSEFVTPLGPDPKGVLPLGFSENPLVLNRPEFAPEFSSALITPATPYKRPELSVCSTASSYNAAYPPAIDTHDSFVRSLDSRRTPLSALRLPAGSSRSNLRSRTSSSSFPQLFPSLENSAFLGSTSLELSGDSSSEKSTPALAGEGIRNTQVRSLPSIGSFVNSDPRDKVSAGSLLPSLSGSVSCTNTSLPSLTSAASSSSSRTSNNSSRDLISEPVDYFGSAKQKLRGLSEAVAEDEGSMTQVDIAGEQPPSLEHYFGKDKDGLSRMQLNPNLNEGTIP